MKTKKLRLKKPFRVALNIIATIAIIFGLFHTLFNAIMQESYRNYAPTTEEIAEEPTLARYLKGE